MSFTSSQGLSGLASVTRDWSDVASETPSSQQGSQQQARAQPKPLSDEEKAARTARRLKMLETTLGPTPPSLAGRKRASDGASEPPAKRSGLVDTSNVLPTVQPTEKKPAVISVAAQITLSSEQQEILRLVTSGKNIFFTGSAGEFSFSEFSLHGYLTHYDKGRESQCYFGRLCVLFARNSVVHKTPSR